MNAEQTLKMLKPKKVRLILIFLFVFLACVALAIVGFILAGKNESLVALGALGSFLAVLGLAFFIVVCIGTKVRVKEVDGVGLGVYTGFATRFYVNGKLVSKGRYGSGELPDGRKVFCAVNAWTGIVYIGLGESWEKKEQIL